MFFSKEGSLWYVDLPGYPGSKADLLMVANADVLLERLSRGAPSVSVRVAIEHDAIFSKQADLVLAKTEVSPTDWGVYKVFNQVEGKFANLPKEIGLCPVNKFVWGGVHPDVIFMERCF